MAAWSVSVQISSLKHVPPDFLDKLAARKDDVTLRVQGALDGASRETGASRWGRGARAGEAFWHGDTGCLEWRFDSEEALRQAEKKTPLLKLYVYATKGGVNVDPSPANSAAVGTLNLDVRTLRRGVKQWSKLRGAAAPAEILIEAAAKRATPSIEERPEDPPAKQLGKGETTFELCVSLEKAGDLRKLVGRELDDAAQYSPRPRYWFSYELLGVVVQTEQFSAQNIETPDFAVECDWFRLRCSAHELSAELAKPLDVFLCTDELVVAAAQVSLADLLPRKAWPATRSDEDFFSNELRLRRDVASKRPAPALQGAPTPGWLDVFAAIKRVGPSDEECAGFRGPLGREARPLEPTVGLDAQDLGGDDLEPPPPPEPYEDREPFQEEILAGGAPSAAEVDGPAFTGTPDDDDSHYSADEETKGAWRVEVSLLALTRSDGEVAPVSLRYGAPQLGQRTIAETASLDFAATTSVAVRGRGAVAHFEFGTETDVRKLLEQAPLDVEAVDHRGRMVAAGRIDLAAALDGESCRGFSEKAPRGWRRLSAQRRETEVELKGSRQRRFGALTARVVAGRITDSARSPSSESPWSEEDEGFSSEEEADELSESGVRGGNVAPVLRRRRRADPPPPRQGPHRSQAPPRRPPKQQEPSGDGCRYCGAPQPSLAELASLKRDAQQQHDEERRAWEDWRREEERAWASRLRDREQEAIARVEQDAVERCKVERDALAQSRAEYARLEIKLRASLRDCDQRERSLNDAEARLERDRASKVLDLQMLEKRLRDESKHSVEAEVRARKAVEKALASARAAQERAEKRASTADADFDRWRQAHRRTPEAELVARVAKSKAESSDLRARLERGNAETADARAERERLRAHVHRLARALQRARDENRDAARRDLDALRLEYKGREERFVLDGDRRQLKQIKEELDALRRNASEREDRAHVARDAARTVINEMGTPPRRVQPGIRSPSAVFDEDALDAVNGTEYEGGAPAPAREEEVFRSTGSVSHSPVDVQAQHLRLQGEREALLGAGYPAEDPLVRDLDRLIAAAE